MANMHAVVINTAHNNGHGKSVLLVSNLCLNRSLGCGSHICYGTHRRPKSFSLMLTGECRIESVVY